MPKGKTEKGDWSITAVLPGHGLTEGSASTAVSFVIPLPAAPTQHYIKVGENPPPGCVGNVKEPGAEEGNLCVFAAGEDNNQHPAICRSAESTLSCLFAGASEQGTDPSGFLMTVGDEAAGLMFVNGTWAVTAE